MENGKSNGKSTFFKKNIRKYYCSYHKNFYNSISSYYVRDNVDMGYGSLCDLPFDCRENLTSFKLKKNVLQILKFTWMLKILKF